MDRNGLQGLRLPRLCWLGSKPVLCQDQPGNTVTGYCKELERLKRWQDCLYGGSGAFTWAKFEQALAVWEREKGKDGDD